MEKIAIDIGHGQTKVFYKGKEVKFPTAISFAKNNGLNYGTEKVYEFEGKKYVVGKEADESFATTDYNFLHKFAPLIIYHILEKFDIQDRYEKPTIVKTGLSLVDWDKKDDFINRITTCKVNGNELTIKPHLTPQGMGVFKDFASRHNIDDDDRITVIDIGYRTINLIHFERDNHGKFKPIKAKSKAYPGHGVSSIIKPFTEFIENKYKENFSASEIQTYMIKEKFKYDGVVQTDIIEMIKEEKKKFIVTIFNSVLVNDRKTLGISDKVVISGGGAYLLEKARFKPNYIFNKLSEENPSYEFSNVRGYYL